MNYAIIPNHPTLLADVPNETMRDFVMSSLAITDTLEKLQKNLEPFKKSLNSTETMQVVELLESFYSSFSQTKGEELLNTCLKSKIGGGKISLVLLTAGQNIKKLYNLINKVVNSSYWITYEELESLKKLLPDCLNLIKGLYGVVDLSHVLLDNTEVKDIPLQEGVSEVCNLLSITPSDLNSELLSRLDRNGIYPMLSDSEIFKDIFYNSFGEDIEEALAPYEELIPIRECVEVLVGKKDISYLSDKVKSGGEDIGGKTSYFI